MARLLSIALARTVMFLALLLTVCCGSAQVSIGDKLKIFGVIDGHAAGQGQGGQGHTEVVIAVIEHGGTLCIVAVRLSGPRSASVGPLSR